jgi:hypothetical protein
MTEDKEEKKKGSPGPCGIECSGGLESLSGRKAGVRQKPCGLRFTLRAPPLPKK